MKASERERSAIDSLYEISSLVSKTDDPKEALRIILDEIVNALKPNSASICLLNHDTQLLEPEVIYGLPENFNDIAIGLNKGITGWVALHGKPKVIPNVAKESRYITIRPGTCSEMAVPMEDSGNVIGVVVVDSDSLDAFDSSDLKILSLLSAEASRVVSRLWLIQKLRAKANQLESLIHLGQRIAGQLDSATIFRSLAQQGRQLLNCHSCAVYLLNENLDSLEMQSMVGRSGSIKRIDAISLSESALSSSIRRGKQSEVENLRYVDESTFLKVVQSEGLHSMLSSPLIFNNKVIGVIAAYTDKPHRFNNDERKVFGSLATLGGIAVQNARLYARVFTTEDSLRKNEKLTTLGMLAAEIAHEIRNPLTVIKLLFEALDLNFSENDERGRDVVLIGEKLLQLEGIVERVLSFGKTDQNMNGYYDLNEITEETLHLMRLKLEQRKIELIFNPASQCIKVEVNKGQIQQVILNLILNAVAVMTKGGRIEISTREKDQNAHFRISDNGPGMPTEAQDKIFESFLTQRPDGTGLGLSISKRILRSHRGDIKLEASSKKGTTFSFYLPFN